MKRIVSIAIGTALALVMLIRIPQVQAITYGSVDTLDAYPNTGAFIAKSPAGEIFPICSGTLIAPTVFLTASHCTVFFKRQLEPVGFTAHVSFDPSIPYGIQTTGATSLIAVTGVITNPNYSQRQSDSGDIAVLLLAADSTIGITPAITPAVLPTAGLLDTLAAKNGLKDRVFTAAGYGVQNRVVGGGQPFFEDVNPIPRMFAYSKFDALNPGYIRLSQNPALGNGGTCYGDSGGPNFLDVDGVRILVAVTITGDAVCRQSNVDQRLDTASSRAFLAPYVTLP